MNTPICRTCGCSLVRLGISTKVAETLDFQGQHFVFCCKGCIDVFKIDPERYLEETADLIVCPTCLSEKPIGRAALLTVDGKDWYFCHCPRCRELFLEEPEFYIERLNGNLQNGGVQDHNGCCLRPATDATKSL